MKDILLIIKKELTRFFTDYRMLLAMIIPGILIYVIYSIMGPIISSNFTASKDYKYNVYVIGDSSYLTNLEEGFKALEYDVTFNMASSVDEVKDKIENEEADLIIEFINLDVEINNNLLINLYFNSAKTESQNLYLQTSTILSSMQVDPNDYKFTLAQSDLATDEQTSSSIISMMLPFLLLIFLCTGVMSVAPESIAGEKDRGTIATLLVTPLKRTHLAIGKIISLSIISLVGGISSFIGTILSLPNLMGNQGDVNLYYGPMDYIYLLLIIISILLLFVGIYSIASAIAKTVKEASAYSTPIMVIAMIIGILSMVSTLPTDNLAVYFIPIYNSLVAMSTILSLEINIIGVVISIISNLCYSIIFAIILGKMFNSERIMFNK